MKKLLILTAMILPTMLIGNTIWGGPGDRIRGTAPGDTLIDTLLVTVRIPARIGLYVQGNTTFDLGAAGVTYPPLLWPGYYDPTAVGGTNTDGVDVEVFSNSNSMTWHLQTRGSGDFTATVALGQLWYAPDGEANPPDGGAPGGNWVAYTTTYTEIASGLKTTGWQTEYQDYVFQAQTDDEPTAVAGAVVTVYYRLYAE